MHSRFVSAVAALAFGFLLLAAIEAGLRLFGVGEDLPRVDPFSGFSSEQPAFERKTREDGVAVYRLSEARAPRSDRQFEVEPQREFLAEAAPDSFRVFVIGGSSAAGVPYSSNHAFSGWLERRLTAALPERRVEVVNAALSGYASRRLLPIVREIAAYEPDLLIVYMGHNEWAERQYYAHLIDMDPRLFALWEWAASLRMYRILSAALLGDRSDTGPPPVETDARANSQQMFAVRQGRAAGRGYATPRDIEYRDLLYRFNLQEMIAAMDAVGARVALLSLSQNFADWEPGASAHRQTLTASELARFEELFAAGRALQGAGDCGEALRQFEQAERIDDRYAALHYRVAECERALGRPEVARARFRLASDLDQVPHGAPTSFNAILRELADDEGAVFVDVDAAVEAAAPDGLVGDEFFVDFVHPNIATHQLIAARTEDALREAGLPIPAGEWGRGVEADPDPDDLYAAQPLLRIRELEVKLFTCELALRDDCADELTRRLLEIDPQNAVAVQSQQRRARSVRPD